MLQSMLRAGLLEEVPARDDVTMLLRITAAGLVAVGELSCAEPAGEAAQSAQEGEGEQQTSIAAPEGQEPPPSPTVAPARTSLRTAMTALLVAWDAGVERSGLPVSIEALRAALTRGAANRPAPDPSAPRRPREGTKNQAVLTLLRRPEGATIAGIMDATGWAQQTVRGFLAGLKKRAPWSVRPCSACSETSSTTGWMWWWSTRSTASPAP
jgi:hypothetical protein